MNEKEISYRWFDGLVKINVGIVPESWLFWSRLLLIIEVNNWGGKKKRKCNVFSYRSYKLINPPSSVGIGPESLLDWRYLFECNFKLCWKKK